MSQNFMGQKYPLRPQIIRHKGRKYKKAEANFASALTYSIIIEMISIAPVPR